MVNLKHLVGCELNLMEVKSNTDSGQDITHS